MNTLSDVSNASGTKYHTIESYFIYVSVFRAANVESQKITKLEMALFFQNGEPHGA